MVTRARHPVTLAAASSAPGTKAAVSRRRFAVSNWIAWLPLILLPAIVLGLRAHFLPWKFMWLLAIAIFAGCKWQSWWAARESGKRRRWWRDAGYLLFWPGMGAKEFLDVSRQPPQTAAREWFAAAGKATLGAGLIWLGVRAVPIAHPLLQGWMGMLGLILLLHFGTFHLMALCWQRAGVSATPIMCRPLSSRSLGEFWGKRWNLGFRQLSHAFVFKPLQKRAGTGVATLAAFLASGLIHDFVISVPAGAGYGLPTGYFLLQGIGVIVERSAVGMRFGLGAGVRGWVWMALVTAAPAFWLFHPWFVERILLPFLRAIGA